MFFNGYSYEVVSIDDNAFKGNNKITKVTINADLVYIGDYAFQSCTSLKYLYINRELERIGRKAFYKCRQLKKIVIKTDLLEEIGKSAFAKTYKKATVLTQANLVRLYKKMLQNAGLSKKAKVKEYK